MMYLCKILPNLKDERFLEVNLASENDLTRSGDMSSIDSQESLLTNIKEKYNTKYTIGGYLEERSKLWEGFEASKKMLHLGIDINNLEVGESVSVPCDATVFHVYKDKSVMNGWGGRLIFKLDQPYLGAEYLMYGHLSHELPEVGTKFKRDEIVASIGPATENGGWFIHLHVQLVTQKMIDRFPDLNMIDGYLLDSDDFTPEEVSADPVDLICTRA